MAIKKTFHKGISSSSKPEKICRIYFKLKICVNEQTIYESEGCDQELKGKKDENQIDFLEKQTNCLKYYLDELKISKLLKNSLSKMKK